MTKKHLLLLALIFLGAFQPPCQANYDTQEEHRGKSQAGTGAAISLFTAVLQQAIQKKEEEKPPEPPPVITVVEIPADEELKGPCHAEVEVEHPDKKEPFVFDVQVYIPPSAADTLACCEMRSVELVNRWQHPLEFRVAKAAGKVVGPGEKIKLEGKWGECVRITALSHGQQEKTDERLVIEDMYFCCNELRTKGARRFTAMQLVDFSFEEKNPPCKENTDEFKFICCESCPGHLGDRFYSPLPPDTECQPGDIRHDELVFGEKPCANPLLEPQYYPGPIIPNPACPEKEEGSCPSEYRPCSPQPRLCFEGFVDKCIQTESCRYPCCQCVPETTTTTNDQCPSGYNACGSPAECAEGMKQDCIQTETCEKPCCRCTPETDTKDQCPSGYNPCGTLVECAKDFTRQCVQVETCSQECCKCGPKIKENSCPSGYPPCGTPVECPEGSVRQCVQTASCPEECCKCEPKTEDKNYCPDDYPPCGTPVECPEGFTPDCVKVSTCPEACCKCVSVIKEENYCPAGYPPCGAPPPICPEKSVLQCVKTATCPEECCKCVPKIDDDDECPPGYPPCGTQVECPEGFIRNCIKVPACPEECCKCEPQDKRSCPPGFGPCSPDPIQCPPNTIKECVQSPDCPYDCCHCVEPPPPPCQCSCDLTEDWQPFQPIEVNLVSPVVPAAEPLVIPLNAQLPLVANASDTDLLKFMCEKKSWGGDHCDPPCMSEENLALPINAEYAWEIVQGEGTLVSDPSPPLKGGKTASGPATIYVAPSRLPPDPRVRIELTVSDDSRHRRNMPDGLQKVEIHFELTDKIEKVEIPYGGGKPPWAEAPDPPPSDCSCRPQKEWEPNGGLSGPDKEERYLMCAGHHLVLSNWAEDADEYKLRCNDPECGQPEKKDTQNDAILYTWSPSAGEIIGESDKIVFRAPAEAGRVTVSRRASDSGLQAGDGSKDFTPVTIDVIKVDLQAAGIKEEDELKRGAVVAYNKDNDDFEVAGVRNYDPDREQNEVAGENDLKEVVLDVQLGEVNEGEVRFEISEGAGGADADNTRLKVWESPEKMNLVLDGATRIKTWSAAEFKALPQPVHFYVEGFKRSDHVKDAELRLIYARQAGADPMCLDRVKYTVFELLLDAEPDDALTDDNGTYLPGYDAAGNPRINAPNGHHLTRLIAAPLNEEVADIARFVIFQSTNFHGIAMNRGDVEDNDYSFEVSGDVLEKAAAGFADERARMDFFVRDYGGESRQEVALERDGMFLVSAELRVPLDTDRDHLPDIWENQHAMDPRNPNTDGDAQADAAEDDDATPAVAGAPPQGLTGDGLAAREEYRGFFYGQPNNTGHRHYRTSPQVKDLFVHSTVFEGAVDLGIAHLPTANLPLLAYRINGDEWLSRSTKQINFNALPETTLQRALDLDTRVTPVAGLYGLCYPGGIDTGANGICESAAVPDDSQIIPVGQGRPGSVVITPGRNGYLEIQLSGDDIRDGHVVRTGPNGILNTPAHPDDAPVFAVGQGEPNRVAIRAATGAALTTAHAGGDDVINGNEITTGPNGVAETAAAEGDEQTIAVGRGEPNTIGIQPGGNGILDPVRGGDDELTGNTVTSGLDGIANTAALPGDEQKIPVGQGEPHALCVQRGPSANYSRKSAPAGDDIAQDTGALLVNESPNEHSTIEIYVHNFNVIVPTSGDNGVWEGGPGAPGSDDVTVNLTGAANQVRRHNWIRKTMTHEGGHGIHIDHYRPPGAAGHASPWSVMRSAIWGLAAPANYDATDANQRRLHLKH